MYNYDAADVLREDLQRHARGPARQRPGARHRAGVHRLRRRLPRLARSGAAPASSTRGRSIRCTATARLLERHYDGMKRYVDYLTSTAKDHIVVHGLGDWYDIGPGGPGESQLTSKGLTATAIYYQDLVILAEAAQLPGQGRRCAQRFGDLARAGPGRLQRASSSTPTRSHYDRDSQTANAMPLVLGPGRRTTGAPPCSTSWSQAIRANGQPGHGRRRGLPLPGPGPLRRRTRRRALRHAHPRRLARATPTSSSRAPPP